MPKINLAQETMRNQIVAHRRRVIYVLSTVLLLLVAAVYLAGLLLTKNVEGKVVDVNQRIAVLESQLQAKEPGGKNIKAFSSRLVNVKSLLKNHVRWSQVFTELERLVLPNTAITALKGGMEKSTITVDVNAPTIESLADLVVSLQHAIGANETYFSAVTASALSTVKDSTDQAKTAGFATVLSLEVKPEAFNEPVEQVLQATPEPAPVNPLIP